MSENISIHESKVTKTIHNIPLESYAAWVIESALISIQISAADAFVIFKTMSIHVGNLCKEILEQHFGVIVRRVAITLIDAQSRSLSSIIKASSLSRKEVTNALAIMMKFRLASFVPSATNETVAEYSLNFENILLILRFPKYVHWLQVEMGEHSSILLEELLRNGTDTASNIVIKAMRNSEGDNPPTLQNFRDTFKKIVSANYIMRAPVPSASDDETNVPILQMDQHELFTCPELAITDLMQLKQDPKHKTTDANIMWIVNYQRFHQDFRDQIMIAAMKRRIDSNAADCLRFILDQMYQRTDSWVALSNPIPYVDIRQAIDKKSNNLTLIKFPEQYMTVLCEDQLNFISKSDVMGGGQYIVHLKNAIEQLTWATIENVITEKFGSKAARIFRVVRTKKYIEQEDIQKEAMVPAKDAKFLTYKLMEESFLNIQTIRKAGGGGGGPAKTYYLFFVNQTQIVAMLLEICYKSMYNAIIRSNNEKSVNKRLIDKSQRLKAIIEAMKERGESEEYITELHETLTPPEREILGKINARIDMCHNSEIGLDETMFLLQMYQYYIPLK